MGGKYEYFAIIRNASSGVKELYPMRGRNLKKLRHDIVIRYGAGWRVQIFEEWASGDTTLVAEYVTRKYI